MNFKPFYVRNEGIDRELISLLYNLCLKEGAKSFCNFDHISINDDCYLGVNLEENTIRSPTPEFFSEVGIEELNILEAINHVDKPTMRLEPGLESKLITSEPSLKFSELKSNYVVKVYVNHGYFEYSISEMNSALEHAGLIAERGVYRRSNERGEVEFHKVVKTKVCGEGLESEYPDVFKRT